MDDNSRCGAASLGHDVAGDAGVVPRVGEPGLRDDQVVVGARVGESIRAQRLFVLQPFHLNTAEDTDDVRTGHMEG